MIHIWTADVYESDKWSSQWISNLSNWNNEAWKTFRASTGFEPVTSIRDTGAMLYQLSYWSHTLGARSIVSSYFPVRGVKWCNVYEMIHIWTADEYESDNWSSQWISNLSNWNKEAWKKFRASTGSEPVTSAIPVRCSTNWAIEATHWQRGQLWAHWQRGQLWASHRYRGGHGFKSRWSPEFLFRLFYSNCLNWKFTATISYHFHSMFYCTHGVLQVLDFGSLFFRWNYSYSCPGCCTSSHFCRRRMAAFQISKD